MGAAGAGGPDRGHRRRADPGRHHAAHPGHQGARASSTGSCRPDLFLADHRSATRRFQPAAPRSTRLRDRRPGGWRTIRDLQGENADSRFNTLVGEFLIEGLAESGGQPDPRPARPGPERHPQGDGDRARHGLAKHVTIDNATERFRNRQRSDAIDRLQATFESVADQEDEDIGQETPILSLQAPPRGTSTKRTIRQPPWPPLCEPSSTPPTSLRPRQNTSSPAPTTQTRRSLRALLAAFARPSNGDRKTKSRASVGDRGHPLLPGRQVID